MAAMEKQQLEELPVTHEASEALTGRARWFWRGSADPLLHSAFFSLEQRGGDMKQSGKMGGNEEKLKQNWEVVKEINDGVLDIRNLSKK